MNLKLNPKANISKEDGDRMKEVLLKYMNTSIHNVPGAENIRKKEDLGKLAKAKIKLRDFIPHKK